MKYEVKIKKKALRGLEKLPVDVRKLLFLLIEDLIEVYYVGSREKAPY